MGFAPLVHCHSLTNSRWIPSASSALAKTRLHAEGLPQGWFGSDPLWKLQALPHRAMARSLVCGHTQTTSTPGGPWSFGPLAASGLAAPPEYGRVIAWLVSRLRSRLSSVALTNETIFLQ